MILSSKEDDLLRAIRQGGLLCFEDEINFLDSCVFNADMLFCSLLVKFLTQKGIISIIRGRGSALCLPNWATTPFVPRACRCETARVRPCILRRYIWSFRISLYWATKAKSQLSS